MRIGVPTEVKNRETRVALTPEGARRLVAAGHDVVVQEGAGAGSFLTDDAYRAAGARIGSRDDAWGAALVLKVKEPVPEEYALLSDNLLFTFLHLAANEPLARALIAAGTTAVSYDTVQEDDGSLPILAPMSAIAGALAVIEGGHHLLSPYGGRGVLLGGAPGVAGARVVVIGAGVAGTAALHQAVVAGADAVVLDLDAARLDAAAQRYGDRVRAVASSPDAIETELADADLVIGAVLVPGRPAPMVVPHRLVERMRPGSVLVDIAIDQGGCFEDSRPTTHDDPVYVVAGSLMYAVANMPGAVGATATAALAHAAAGYVDALAARGRSALENLPALGRGLNVDAGTLRCRAVAQAHPHLPSLPPLREAAGR
ncbi:alanine dehydrogenase [Demequina litorisediminis]|uniref:Alanine dehydrogenase n=1 Tax=Demequina litorisediminis TaxID=1849022 RepID=A0ABQ6IFN3_9MICO|nr:alanine dehydrogenase [Demequina litorisediminis]GMA36575.1 alanine dehydrogenase [Demequina litorisediminis]